MYRPAMVDEAELGNLARLVARLSPAQQRLLVALDDAVLSDARTWLARRPRPQLDRLDPTG
jgi:hypothetical protein